MSEGQLRRHRSAKRIRCCRYESTCPQTGTGCDHSGKLFILTPRAISRPSHSTILTPSPTQK